MRKFLQIILISLIHSSCTTDNKTEIENRAKILADSLFDNQVRQQDSFKNKSDTINNLPSKQKQSFSDLSKKVSETEESISENQVDNGSGFENINGIYSFYNRELRDKVIPANNTDLRMAISVNIKLFELTGGGDIVIQEVSRNGAELQIITYSCTITSKPRKKIDEANHIIRTIYSCDVLVNIYKRASEHENDVDSRSNFEKWQIELLLNEATNDFRVILHDTNQKQTISYSQ